MSELATDTLSKIYQLGFTKTADVMIIFAMFELREATAEEIAEYMNRECHVLVSGNILTRIKSWERRKWVEVARTQKQCGRPKTFYALTDAGRIVINSLKDL